jgi:hypothetical protein
MNFAQEMSPHVGSHDGAGASDRDLLYRFGSRPRATVPYPFSTRQYARLLILRSRIQAGLFGSGDLSARLHSARVSLPVQARARDYKQSDSGMRKAPWAIIATFKKRTRSNANACCAPAVEK